MIEIDGYKFRVFVDKHSNRVRIKHYTITPANIFFPWLGKTENWYWICMLGGRDVAEWSSVEEAYAWIEAKRLPVWEEINE